MKENHVIKITLEFENYVKASEALAALAGYTVATKPAADVPNPPKAEAAGKPAAVKPTPAPAPVASSPAPTPSAALAAAAADPIPEDLTKIVVAAVGRVGREKVVAHLRDVYSVAKGTEITDVPTRIKAMASVAAL